MFKNRSKYASYTPSHSTIKPSLADNTVSADLAGVSGIDKAGLSEPEKAMLVKNLFFMRPSDDEQIYDIYNNVARGLIPFITTDTMLHAYHVLFDYILRILENGKFSADLAELTRSMLDGSIAKLNSGMPSLQEPAMRNIAFFKVALMLLGADAEVPEKARTMAQDEFNLINDHSRSARSPIFGYYEDYTQYVPRGHYTRNETLQKYFKAMMWYGRMAFRINTEDPEYNQSQALSSLLVLMGLQGHAYDLWKGIYETITFFIGETDDLTIFDLNALALDVYGGEIRLSDLSDVSKLSAFMDRAVNLKDPLIASSPISSEDEIKGLIGLRFMGQRFTPDSYIFELLVDDNVPGRYMPMGLDLMAAYGSKRAFEILDDVYHETRYPGYRAQLSQLKLNFSALGEDDWTGSLYRSWIYCLLALLDEGRDGYPTFMKGRVWADKELNTSLGSWTEMRHDTILYAKQSARTRGSHPGPILAQGYVEPIPEFYGRLWSTVKMTYDGLSSRGLIVKDFEERIKSLMAILASLKTISEKELTGQSLTQEENDVMLWKVGNLLLNLSTYYYASDSKSVTTDEDKRMAIVADVHTDANAKMVLEEGIGRPYHIFVIVSVNGGLALAEGAAFSYYEFKQPMSERLTDEQWQDMLKNGRAPETPEWVKSFKV